MNELEPMPNFATRLLEAERRAPPPRASGDVLERVLGRVEKTVGMGAAAAAAGAGAGVAAKLLLVGTGLLAGAAGTLLWQRDNVFVAEPIVVVQRVEVKVEVPVARPDEPSSTLPTLAKSPLPPSAASDSLDGEQRLLDTARGARATAL